MTASGRALLIVVVVSVGLGGFLASRFLAAPPVPEPSRAAAPTPVLAQGAEPRPAAAPAAPPATVVLPAGPEAPRFDVVRVGARGGAVVAGRAAPAPRSHCSRKGGRSAGPARMRVANG